jgi:peptide/nickel transport system substrate-binding protein
MKLCRAVAALIVVLLAAMACGGPSNQGVGASADKLVFSVPDAIRSLDLNNIEDVSAHILLRGSVLETLTRVQKTNDGRLQWVPLLADTITRVAPDRWRFTIKQGVKFHNGKSLGAADVAYSINRRLEPGAEPSNILVNLKNAVVVDDHTVDVIAKGPDAYVDRSVYYIGIQPEGWGQSANSATEAIGTGPYELTQYAADGTSATLTAWADYRGAKPGIKSIEMKVIPEAGSAYAALTKGEVNAAFQLTPDVLAKAPNTIRAKGSEVQFLRINTDNPALSDPKVRQALNMAIDRDTIIKNLLLGFGSPAQGQGIPSEAIGFNGGLSDYKFDPDAARKLVQDAGVAGTKLSMMCPSDRYGQVGVNICQVEAEQIKAIGFDVGVTMVSSDDWINDGIYAPKNHLQIPDLFWMSASSLSLTAGPYLQSWYLCENGRSTYCPPDLEAKVRAAASIEDLAQQTTAWQGLQSELYDAAPMVFATVPDNAVGTSGNVKGVVYPVPDDIYWPEWTIG